MMYILHFVDLAFFIFMFVSVTYIFLFAFFSMFDSRKKVIHTPVKQLKYVVLVPAYKEDIVIFDTVKALLAQEFPKSNYDIVVISDKMKDETNLLLSNFPITLLKIYPDKSSKAYALNQAIDYLNGRTYDAIIILDADNLVEPGFVSDINIAFCYGEMAVQAHRVAKNLNNDMAILDAISEEINNSIFRKGHVNMGLSSALIGSGMAFQFKWFCDNVKHLTTAGEDKELERLLLKERVFINYLSETYVYDEKIQKAGTFFNQRRRWIASQYGALFASMKDLPKALFTFNIDYIDKIFQWILLPRVVMLGIIVIFAIITGIIDYSYSLKWGLLLVSVIVSFAMATPDYLVNRRSIKAMKMIPVIFIMMCVNYLRLKGVNNNFIHTKKG